MAGMTLDLPKRDFPGIIFDCDGTLVDSMPLHFRAWTGAFEQIGAPWQWSEDEFYANAGVPDRVTVMELNERHNATIDPDEVHRLKEAWYQEHMHELKPVAAVAELARRYAEEGKPISVASGSDISLVEPSLEIAGLRDLFEIIVTPRDVERGKPFPDMFLLAAEKMAVPAADCLVFEDGQAGIDAAIAADMAWVFVPSRG